MNQEKQLGKDGFDVWVQTETKNVLHIWSSYEQQKKQQAYAKSQALNK